jgi:HTH-type transcriptional regulator/antitoxin HigA
MRKANIRTPMTAETDYKTPGQLIQDLLDERAWTQRVLALVLGSDETTVNKVIRAQRPLDAEMALALSEIFGVAAEVFMDLQKSWDLTQARLLSRPNPGRTNRAHLFSNLPVAEMIKRGWLENVDDVRNMPRVEAALTKFFGATSFDEIEILPHAAKKTDVTGEVTPAQIAWLYRVKEIATEMLVPRYSHTAVEDAVNKLKPLRVSAAAVRKVPRILTEAGIRFLIVEALPGSKIDGVCFWLNGSPVIALSLRFDRIDNFWFVLRHELEHVLQLHGRAAVRVDAELDGERGGVGPNLPEEERVANKAAAEFCVPQTALESFITRKSPFFAERDIVGFARVSEIHPGLVAGQLQRRIDRYDRFRTHLVKIRAFVAPGAIVDGWGDVAPVGL